MALGPEQLALGLEARYGISVRGVFALDEATWHIARDDGGDWVARVFAPERPLAATTGDAAVLAALARDDYPAERCATADAVATVDGHAVLVTDHEAPVAPARRAATIKELGGLRALGEMLARLALLPAAAVTDRPGGAWHHLADGGPAQEIAAAAAMLERAGDRLAGAELAAHEQLAGALRAFDDGSGLPAGLVHPDFVMRNVVAARERGLVVVDWAGAGVGPRAWALAWLLFSEGAKDVRRAQLVAAGYARRVTPEPAELARLAGLMVVRPAILAIWSCCVGRIGARDACERVAAARARVEPIAAAAVAAFDHLAAIQSSRTIATIPTATINTRSGPGRRRRP